MSDTLTVRTSCQDISELVSALAPRADERNLTLPGNTPFEEGADVRFEVLLADGTASVAGSAIVVELRDYGESSEADRYEVVLGALKLEPMAEVVYERILLARNASGEVQGTGEFALDRVDEVEAAAASETGEAQLPEWQETTSAFAAPSDPGELVDPDATQVGDTTALLEAPPAASAPPPVPSAPPLPTSTPPTSVAKVRSMPPSVGNSLLTRPSHPPSWVPEADIRPSQRPPSGLFAHRAGLPVPAGPPRPAGADPRRFSMPPAARTSASPPAPESYEDAVPLEGDDES